jgi:hypothetical protein
VTTGTNIGSKKIEVIDLSDSSNVCQPSVLADYPLDKVEGASGGLLNNNVALICGGDNFPTIHDDCFPITANAIEASVKLTKPKVGSSSVVLNGSTLWLTGGFLKELKEETDEYQEYFYVETKSTEFVQLNGPSPGPDLPHKVGSHCLVSLNDSIVILIGGFQGGKHLEDTFYYNNDHQTWTEGPSLINGRYDHSCALFKSPLHGDTVIVTGGYGQDGTLASTELLNLDSNSWTLGKDIFKLKLNCIMWKCKKIHWVNILEHRLQWYPQGFL